ncbi:hypothetical protein MBM_06805 [Drepanopeziza brunnea f. sp. 'multigermtubi' MB_m1]|uniref:HNH domain-containing protein n=1 Tax=Marssonina brunnea f. sp. multigermtubi (strain MB_m1) TaxID=1072389 RepID=K1XR10_MARBU|nr:uncharacterized protein MBM_06805 [Drepanopeziza brunnea f. sp. 'multigermtubi' MB_m1]EKD15044.1 hypothetical protein MBM_06805 [Drepanopeziza brunnea f. sp. 'multigermtubi' MB_m1]
MDPSEESNFLLFRDCLSTPLIELSSNTPANPSKKTRRARGGRKNAIKPVVPIEDESKTSDAEELGEFIDYLATEIFSSLPPEVRSLSHSTWLNGTPSHQALYTTPLSPSVAGGILDTLPPSIGDSLTSYALLPDLKTPAEFLAPVLNGYVETLLRPPPPPRQTLRDVDECEICARGWIPLTFHHLIPRGVHAKALKRGWHAEDQLENVAWLCRACHSFVHRVATLEELAREFFTVERLVEREDVRRFAEWVGKVRWKAR